MAVRTEYIVQAFQELESGALHVDEPFIASTAEAARNWVMILAASVAGVIAYETGADVETGDYIEPIVLSRFGKVPAERG
jgi:hypothetical protein